LPRSPTSSSTAYRADVDLNCLLFAVWTAEQFCAVEQDDRGGWQHSQVARGRRCVADPHSLLSAQVKAGMRKVDLAPGLLKFFQGARRIGSRPFWSPGTFGPRQETLTRDSSLELLEKSHFHQRG